ncbi:MAG: hypothetical protein WCC17_09730, partial [Candidatus Nitrosopolaris sp.]
MYTGVRRDDDTDTQKTTEEGHHAAEDSECEAAVYERKVENSADENESETGAIRRDEEISACFDRAKKNLNGLLKSKRQVIRDLACELERLGRPVDHIAAEIVHELRNCEELSRSQIYSYLDDKYKNQTQAQRRKGKSNLNPDPKTGTKSPQEQTITVGSNGQQITSNKHDIPELKEPAESVTSNQQSNPADPQKSDWSPDPKTGTKSWSSEQGRTEQNANTNTNASEPGSMSALHTSSQSIDVHTTGEDSMFPGPRDKSPVCENCLIEDNRTKKLEDENRELGVRCNLAESSNSELILQLTAQDNYIDKLLEDEHDLSHSPDKYVWQDCPSFPELEEKVIELSGAPKHTPMRTPDEIPTSESEFIIPKEKYDMVRDAMDKSKGAIFVKCYGSKKFVRAVA